MRTSHLMAARVIMRALFLAREEGPVASAGKRLCMLTLSPTEKSSRAPSPDLQSCSATLMKSLEGSPERSPVCQYKPDCAHRKRLQSTGWVSVGADLFRAPMRPFMSEKPNVPRRTM